MVLLGRTNLWPNLKFYYCFKKRLNLTSWI